MEQKSSQLVKAVLAVMKAIPDIGQNTTIGSGNYSYKGTKDSDVKKLYSEEMAKNGLIILPIGIEETAELKVLKDRNQNEREVFFTKVVTTYELIHESGESKILKGYGHGIDGGDKGAGKATTYAMKYMLLYTFMASVGGEGLDDSDKTHSKELIDDMEIPTKQRASETRPLKEKLDGPKKSDKTPRGEKRWLNKTKKGGIVTPQWLNVMDEIIRGDITSIKQVRERYMVSTDLAKMLQAEIKLRKK